MSGKAKDFGCPELANCLYMGKIIWGKYEFPQQEEKKELKNANGDWEIRPNGIVRK